MKRNSKKGMSLAITLISMSIVFVLSALMLSYTLYSSHMAGLATQKAEDKVKLDIIAEDFLRLGDSFGESYVNNKGYSGDTSGDEYTITKNGQYKITVKRDGETRTLIVNSYKNNNRLMSVSYEDTGVGGVSNIVLKSWKYGR